MPNRRTVVLDIGKTNKKLFVYDDALTCLNPDEQGAQFDPLEWEGLICDDMESIRRWMFDGLSRVAAEFGNIGAISISTHGATIALLGEGRDRVFPGDGGLAFPIVSYENDIGDEAEAAFFADIGMSPEEAQRRTATARFPWLVNHGKQIHYLQHLMPDRFAQVTAILMFPQYVGCLLTGKKAVEPTYVGCHGYLLDANGREYSEVAKRLGVADKLPPLPFSRTWDALGTLLPEVTEETGLDPDCIVTLGAHDSNAALVPYFAKGLKDFVVQDSGTWVVTMAPCEAAEFAPEELGKEVFFNRSIYGKPVKTTIFRGGSEFDFYRRNILDGKAHPPDLNEGILREIIEGRAAFSLPAIDRGSGLFPDSSARLEGLDVVFSDAAHAWHVVDLGLAVQGYQGIVMAAGEGAGNIYIEGNVGRHNPVYRSVISSLFPAATVRYGSMGGAPFGAALLGVAALEGVPPEQLSDRFEIQLDEVPKLAIAPAALRRYVAEFLRRTA